MKSRFLAVVLLSAILLIPGIGAANSSPKCIKLSSYLPKKILSGSQASAGKLIYLKASAVRSPDFTKVYFVAIKFKAIGVGSQIGVWATNALPQKVSQPMGVVMSVDGFAKNFTSWTDAGRSSANISGGDPSVGAAMRCLK